MKEDRSAVDCFLLNIANIANIQTSIPFTTSGTAEEDQLSALRMYVAKRPPATSGNSPTIFGLVKPCDA